ncbi:MAG: hypothetical protein PHG16_10020 [Lachnospiraceae bacterium]|nr:hypothetical protein [Lachnospiraceae bacterium]
MAEKQLTENCTPQETCTTEKQKGNKLFQTVSLILLPFFWIGYFYSLYRGNQSNISSYSIAILTLSLLNADVLFKGEKTQNKVFDVLAKVECILLFVLGIITIILTMVK